MLALVGSAAMPVTRPLTAPAPATWPFATGAGPTSDQEAPLSGTAGGGSDWPDAIESGAMAAAEALAFGMYSRVVGARFGDAML